MQTQKSDTHHNDDKDVLVPQIIGVYMLKEIVKGASGGGTDGFVIGKEN